MFDEGADFLNWLNWVLLWEFDICWNLLSEGSSKSWLRLEPEISSEIFLIYF